MIIMVLGGSVLVNDVIDYDRSVAEDISELKTIYPFTTYSCYPTTTKKPITIKVIAADINLIQKTCATKEDFLHEYRKDLEIIVPFSYKETGCIVYGGQWLDLNKIPSECRHFFQKCEDGRFSLCVGVPDSFKLMKNVILENVRTAANMLNAYEFYLTGKTKKLELIAYAHGQKGIYEYYEKKEKYHTI